MKWFALLMFAFAAVANVVGEAVRSQAVDWLTKPLLMPLLAGYAVLAYRERGVPVDRRLIVALGLATAGDIVLEVPLAGAFILGMLCFLGAYGTYAGMFVRAGRPRPAVVAGYVLFSAAMLVWLWPGLAAQGLAVPMAVYAAVLTAMAATASARGWRIGVGGGLLLVSDALIAMGIAGARWSAFCGGVAGQLSIAGVGASFGPPIWVMLTYTLGQALVVTGWVNAERRVVPVA